MDVDVSTRTDDAAWSRCLLLVTATVGVNAYDDDGMADVDVYALSGQGGLVKRC